jgi:mannose-6-phosphate isomerase
MSNSKVLTLHGKVQHYDWGGLDFIPTFLGIANHAERPFAELWFGAHPEAPATADVGGIGIPLDRLIAEAPDKILGPAVNQRFGGHLPYLLKVLDAGNMLSIQAHPTKSQAVEGFARENAAGIALNAAERNYRDDNHKPEMAVALTDLWMLHGFRPLEQIAELLRKIPELRSVMPDFDQRLTRPGREHSLRDLYCAVMTMPQERVDLLLNALAERLTATVPRDIDDPDYWAARALVSFPPVNGHRDRGIFSIYLLNLLHLRPGQATYQPAGMLHSYLEGAMVELMANSDNVLRGGLTHKHVDVPELMRILSFHSGISLVLGGDPTGAELLYPAPFEDFALTRIQLAEEEHYSGHAQHGPDTLIVTHGAATLTASGCRTALRRGSAFFAPFGARYSLRTTDTEAVLFKASVPCPV